MKPIKPGHYKLTLGIGFHDGACQHEVVQVPEELGVSHSEWASKTPEEQNALMEEVWREWANELIDGEWKLAKEGDRP